MATDQELCVPPLPPGFQHFQHFLNRPSYPQVDRQKLHARRQQVEMRVNQAWNHREAAKIQNFGNTSPAVVRPMARNRCDIAVFRDDQI